MISTILHLYVTEQTCIRKLSVNNPYIKRGPSGTWLFQTLEDEIFQDRNYNTIKLYKLRDVYWRYLMDEQNMV